MDATKYQVISADNLVASATRLRLGCGWFFQQDDDLKHASKFTKMWFSDKRNPCSTMVISGASIQSKTCGLN